MWESNGKSLKVSQDDSFLTCIGKSAEEAVEPPKKIKTLNISRNDGFYKASEERDDVIVTAVVTVPSDLYVHEGIV